MNTVNQPSPWRVARGTGGIHPLTDQDRYIHNYRSKNKPRLMIDNGSMLVRVFFNLNFSSGPSRATCRPTLREPTFSNQAIVSFGLAPTVQVIIKLLIVIAKLLINYIFEDVSGQSLAASSALYFFTLTLLYALHRINYLCLAKYVRCVRTHICRYCMCVQPMNVCAVRACTCACVYMPMTEYSWFLSLIALSCLYFAME